MSQGRCSAVLLILVAAAMVVVFHSQVAQAATYTVGGHGGWTFNVAAWPTGKSFRAGDTLVFNYNAASHNVVPVNGVAYDSCTPHGSVQVYQTGKDQIKLVKGQNFFICNFPGHCQTGMKIAVTAV